MISARRYLELIAFARKHYEHTIFEPIEIVHEAILINEDCNEKNVETAFWAIRRDAKRWMALTAADHRYPKQERYCLGCRDYLPIAAFTYRARGEFMARCDKCRDKMSASWRKKNIDRAREIARKSFDKRKEKHKDYYEKNKARIIARVAEWKKKNPDRVKASLAKRYKKNN